MFKILGENLLSSYNSTSLYTHLEKNIAIPLVWKFHERKIYSILCLPKNLNRKDIGCGRKSFPLDVSREDVPGGAVQ